MTPEEIVRFRNAIKDDNAVFIFYPSPTLKEKLVNKSDPLLNALPIGMMQHLLSCGPGCGIVTDTDLVMKYFDGSIDHRNAYLFSLGTLGVVGVGDMRLNSKPNLNAKSNIDLLK